MFRNTILTGAAALACLAGSALATGHPHGDDEKKTVEKAVNIATYQVSDGKHEVRIIIDGGKPKIFLDGKPVDGSQVETKGGLWRIRGDDGETKARFFLQPQDGGGMSIRVDANEAEVVEEENVRVLRGLMSTNAQRPVMGVMLESVDEATAKQLGIKADQSIIVVGVAPESGAETAGIKANDIIVGIGNEKRGDIETIRAVLGKKSAGDEVPVWVLRGGEKESFIVELMAPEGVTAPPAPEAFLREFEEQSRWGRGAEAEARARRGARNELERRAFVERAPRADDLHERVLREREEALHGRVRELERRMHAEREAYHDHLRRGRELQDKSIEHEHRATLELKKQYELAQRLDGLRDLRVDIDLETRREIEEAMKRATEALEEIEVDVELPEFEFLFKGQGEGGNVIFLPEPPDAKAFGNVWRFRAPEAPAAPRRPAAPGGQALYFGNTGGVDLSDIAERLARIEGILTGMAGQGANCKCSCDKD